MRIFAAACITCAMLFASAHAEDEMSTNIVQLAEDYLAAYSTFEVDKMAPFLADDMVFHDPTSADQTSGGAAIVFEGKENVLRELGDYAAQYKEFSVSYDVERRYHSNGVVVFIAELSYDLVTQDDQSMSGAAPIVTAITVKNGKVTKHLDLYDYAGNAISSGE